MTRPNCRITLWSCLLALLCPSPALCETAPNPADDIIDPRVQARERAISPGLTQQEKTLIKRPDRKRVVQPITLELFDRTLALGGRAEFRGRVQVNRLNDFDYEDIDVVSNFPNPPDVFIEDRRRDPKEHPIEDRARAELNLTLNTFYAISQDISLYLEGRVSFRSRPWREHGREDYEWVFERDETWLFLGNLGGSNFSLQAGRQKFFDGREWFWDQDLDSIRLQYDRENFHGYLGVAQELFGTKNGEGIDPEEEDILRFLLMAQYEWSPKNTIGIYALHHYDYSNPIPVNDPGPDPTGTTRCTLFDAAPPLMTPPVPDDLSGCLREHEEDEADAHLTWVGASAAGRVKTDMGSFHYWTNVAGVFGQETYFNITGDRRAGVRQLLRENKSHHDVRGWGIDLTATYEAKLPFKPRLTVGYAYGSGDNDLEQENDTGFRQTGLQDNSNRWLGVNNFRYYGELTDFELSNMHIVTAALGFPIFEDSSIELVYHYYFQDHKTEYLRDWRPARDPNGRDRRETSDGGTPGRLLTEGISFDRELGWEFDVILGLEEWEQFEVEIVGAVFQAGNAFDVHMQPVASSFVNNKRNELAWMGVAQFRYNF